MPLSFQFIPIIPIHFLFTSYSLPIGCLSISLQFLFIPIHFFSVPLIATVIQKKVSVKGE